MRQKLTLTEERNRMLKLINFDYDQHSHDNLSTTLINESTKQFWTEESATLFNEEVLYSGQLIKESDEDPLGDDFETEEFENEEDADAFLNYASQYLEKLGFDMSEMLEEDEEDEEDSEILNEQRPLLGPGSKGYGKRKRRRKNFWRKVKGALNIDGGGKKKMKRKLRSFKQSLGKAGKNIGDWFGDTMRTLKKKWKGLGKDIKKGFKNMGKAIGKAGRKLRRGIPIRIGKYKPSESAEMSSSGEFTIKTEESEWDALLESKAAKKMVSLMNSSSKKDWELLKADEDNKGFAVAAVEYFTATYKEKKWTKVGVGVDVEQLVKVIPAIEEKTEPKQKEFPIMPIPFPSEVDGHNLFDDNDWKVSSKKGGLKDEVDALIDTLTKKLGELNPPEGKPKATLNGIYLTSSCSRFRNGGKAQNMSFKELAEKRATTVRNYVIARLSEIGIQKNEGYTESIDATGTNGDGSSGPNPPIGFSYIPVGSGVPMSPNCGANQKECDINGKMVKRDEAGQPLTNKEGYDTFKYVAGDIDIVLNTSEGGGKGSTPDDKSSTPPNLEVIDVVEYPISFYAPPKNPLQFKIKIKWPRIRRNGKVTYKQPKGRSKSSTACPAFD